MYDPHDVLARIDCHVIPILAICAFTLIGTYVWFIAGIRAAVRDRTYSMPVFCTLFWFAHDSSFVARFDKWFGTYDHWFLKLFWVALVITMIVELIYVGQVFRYGRAELAAQLSQRGFGVLLIAATTFALVFWWMVKAALGDSTALGDDLYITAFGLTVAIYPPLGIALMLRRRSTKSQTRTMWAGFCCLSLGWFSVTTLYLGPTYLQWQWIVLGVFSTMGGLAGLFLIHLDRRVGILSRENPSPETKDAALTTSAA